MLFRGKLDVSSERDPSFNSGEAGTEILRVWLSFTCIRPEEMGFSGLPFQSSQSQAAGIVRATETSAIKGVADSQFWGCQVVDFVGAKGWQNG